jgi:hypothetical protein
VGPWHCMRYVGDSGMVTMKESRLLRLDPKLNEVRKQATAEGGKKEQ